MDKEVKVISQRIQERYCINFNSNCTSWKLFLFTFVVMAQCSRGEVHSTLPPPDRPAKILIWPAEFSHWINLKILAGNLVQRGHQVTVLRSSAYQDFMEETDEFQFINFEVTGFKPGDHLMSMDHVLHLLKLGDGKSSTLQTIRGMVHFWREQLGMRERQCNSIMTNQEILSRLAAERYDLVLADATVFGGEIIAQKLGIPFVYTVRTLPAEAQFMFSQTPIPISYVPMINTEFTDRMNFLQRTTNALTYIYQNVGVDLYSNFIMSPLVQQYLGPESSYQTVMKNASLWLIRMDFAFEYPRPLMPNVKFIGGFHCKPASPLSPELRSFIDGSGKEGFIVFSMGSMVRNMHKAKANLIASAFAKLKQRVIWRYLGENPDTLGENTKIMSWLPQNDLLGHPKCRLFVTHGGTNGLYEAIYHSVPMLGFPLLVDQFDNMARIKDRGAGRTMDITNLNVTELYLTMTELIHNKSYKENAARLSERHRDTPMRPLDSATYWIEYAIRHKGAYHLRPAAHDLWWFQYQMLDVKAFLATLVIGVALLLRKLFRLCSFRADKVQKQHKLQKENGHAVFKQRPVADNHDNGFAPTEGLVRRGQNGIRSTELLNQNGHATSTFFKRNFCYKCSRSFGD